MIKTEEIFQEFITDRNIQKETQRNYYKTLKLYSELYNMSLQELIDEADFEEEQGIRAKRRKITKKLKKYRNWLIENNYEVNTIKDYFAKIKTFYRHFEIEIPFIPPIQLKKTNHERYDDIPHKKHIKEALESTNNLKYKAIILFMFSSGSARAETLSMTVADFIKSTKNYHDSTQIKNVIKELENQKDVIPLIEMVRSKTNHPYYTCCSPEASEMIIKYLKTRTNLKSTDKLFEIAPDTLTKAFQRINNKIGWGKVNYYSFFHSHSIRKYHATLIEDMGLANALQGRKADSVTEAYFKHNPKRIKEKYMEHLPKLTINKTEINILNDEGTKKLKKVEAELAEMKQNKEQEREEIISDVLKIIQDNPDFLKDRLSKIDDL